MRRNRIIRLKMILKLQCSGSRASTGQIEYDPVSGIPHSRLQIKKGYPVYHFLELISDWDEFSGMDPATEVSLWEVDFYFDNKRVGVIVSDYRAYDNDFYLYDE